MFRLSKRWGLSVGMLGLSECGPRVSRTHAESARQHDEILDALTEGDAATASARTYQHIMGADPVKEVSQ